MNMNGYGRYTDYGSHRRAATYIKNHPGEFEIVRALVNGSSKTYYRKRNGKWLPESEAIDLIVE